MGHCVEGLVTSRAANVLYLQATSIQPAILRTAVGFGVGLLQCTPYMYMHVHVHDMYMYMYMYMHRLVCGDVQRADRRVVGPSAGAHTLNECSLYVITIEVEPLTIE